MSETRVICSLGQVLVYSFDIVISLHGLINDNPLTILFVFEIETREAFTAPYENVCAAQIQLKMEIPLVQITRRIERYSIIATFYLVRV